MNNGADGAPPNHHRPWSVGRRFAGPTGLSRAQELSPLDLNCLQANGRCGDEQRKVIAGMRLR